MTPVRIDEPTLIYPGYSDGIEWGGVAVDRERDLMVVHSLSLAIRAHRIPRDAADRLGLGPEVNDPGGRSAQAGTPHAVARAPFLSPAGALPTTAVGAHRRRRTSWSAIQTQR
jgi:glucose dehydrogenase